MLSPIEHDFAELIGFSTFTRDAEHQFRTGSSGPMERIVSETETPFIDFVQLA